MGARGNSATGTAGRSSPVRRVSEFMVRMAGRMPSREELKAIEADLNELWDRVQRVRKDHPQWSIGRSEDVERYFALIGKAVTTKRSSGFRRAASLL